MRAASSGTSFGILRSPRARLGVAVAFVCALALLGGASRPDEPQQLAIRLASVAALVVALWPLDFAPLRRRQAIVVAAFVLILLPLLQLVPLPAQIWAALPGHAPYAEIARLTDTAQWRPLSLTPDLTLDAALALAPPIAVTILALFLDSLGRHVLFAALAAAAAASALLGLAQFAAGGETFHLYRVTSEDSPVGLLANRNHQAAFLACALPLASAYTAYRMRRGDRPEMVIALLLGCAALLLFGILLTGSRMGLVLGFIGAVSALYCWRRAGLSLISRRAGHRRLQAAVAGLTLLAMGYAVMRGGIVHRLAATNFADESRAASFGPMLETARTFFPFGAGLGSFDAVYRRFEPDQLLSTIYLNQAHDEPMQLAIEGGVPALVLLCLFLLWWVWASWRVLRNSRKANGGGLALACIASSLILMLASLVDYPLRTPLLASLFALACLELARFRVPSD